MPQSADPARPGSTPARNAGGADAAAPDARKTETTAQTAAAAPPMASAVAGGQAGPNNAEESAVVSPKNPPDPAGLAKASFDKMSLEKMDKSAAGSAPSDAAKSDAAGRAPAQSDVKAEASALAAARPDTPPSQSQSQSAGAAAEAAPAPQAAAQTIRVLRNVRQAGAAAGLGAAADLAAGLAHPSAQKPPQSIPQGAAPNVAPTVAQATAPTVAQATAPTVAQATAPTVAQNAPLNAGTPPPEPAAAAQPRAAQRPGPPRWRFFRAVSALILREMATRYGRTPGGYVWALLEPIGGIVVLSVMFSLIARHPALGTNFMLFFATGMLSFQLYLIVANLVGAAIQFSRPLLGYPAMTLMDALIARLLLNTLTQIFASGIILAGIIYFYQLQPVLRWGPIFLSIAMALSLAIGVGAVNAVLFTVLPVWQQFWGIFGRAQFILSGVFFLPEMAPAQFRTLLMWNPVAHVTSQMRKGFYASYDAVYVDPAYVFSIALVLGVFGMLFLIRFHKDIVLR